MNNTPELLSCPHDGSKVKFCDECDGGCHRIIGDGMEIDILPDDHRDDNLESRRAICAERWNTRVYPPEVQKAIEREKLKRPIRLKGSVEIVFKCPSCSEESCWFTQDDPAPKVCCECGQRLD